MSQSRLFLTPWIDLSTEDTICFKNRWVTRTCLPSSFVEHPSKHPSLSRSKQSEVAEFYFARARGMSSNSGSNGHSPASTRRVGCVKRRDVRKEKKKIVRNSFGSSSLAIVSRWAFAIIPYYHWSRYFQTKIRRIVGVDIIQRLLNYAFVEAKGKYWDELINANGECKSAVS